MCNMAREASEKKSKLQLQYNTITEKTYSEAEVASEVMVDPITLDRELVGTTLMTEVSREMSDGSEALDSSIITKYHIIDCSIFITTCSKRSHVVTVTVHHATKEEKN